MLCCRVFVACCMAYLVDIVLRYLVFRASKTGREHRRCRHERNYPQKLHVYEGKGQHDVSLYAVTMGLGVGFTRASADMKGRVSVM